MPKEETKTGQQILDEFYAYPYKIQASITLDALDYMQQYNCRSRTECIALAMGYDTKDRKVYTVRII